MSNFPSTVVHFLSSRGLGLLKKAKGQKRSLHGPWLVKKMPEKHKESAKHMDL